MKNKFNLIINPLIKRELNTKDLMQKYGVSQAYISQIQQKLKKLKHKPKIKDNKVVCRICESSENLLIHKDSEGRPNSILCQECHYKNKGKDIFAGDSNENNAVHIKVEHDVIEAFYDKYKQVKPLVIDNVEFLIKKILLDFIEGNLVYKND